MRLNLMVAGMATLVCISAGPVLAADLETPIADWSGWYAGIGAGFASYNSDASIVGDTEYLGAVDFNEGGDSSTPLGALFFGYNFQTSENIVLSAELLGSYGNAEQNEDFFEAKYDYSFVPSVRAGFLVDDGLLLYARAGWAFTHAEVSIVDNGVDQLTDEGAGVGKSKSGWINGPQIGLGAEFKMTDNLDLGVEGAYTWYNSLKVKGIDPNDTASVVTAKSTPDEISGLIRLSYHF